ncbi:unnamed protein product [Symbiodinium microadriaticum]|nr:unnamed protein product [Symbiodinium microadriaticum]CAE7938933.1 unnamed protein product [Symbiodinium sp. KB8]
MSNKPGRFQCIVAELNTWSFPLSSPAQRQFGDTTLQLPGAPVPHVVLDLDVAVPLDFNAFQVLHVQWSQRGMEDSRSLAEYGSATVAMLQAQQLFAGEVQPAVVTGDRVVNSTHMAETLLDALIDACRVEDAGEDGVCADGDEQGRDGAGAGSQKDTCDWASSSSKRRVNWKK